MNGLLYWNALIVFLVFCELILALLHGYHEAYIKYKMLIVSILCCNSFTPFDRDTKLYPYSLLCFDVTVYLFNIVFI